MSQPPPYNRQADFTGWSINFPSLPHQGTSLDAEFNAVKVTFDALNSNLALIQRDDGKLRNQIVTLDSLSPDAIAVLAGKWTPRGAWVTATAYAVSDVVTSGTATYVAASAHTSSALFATDLAAGRWILLFDTAGTTPADGSVTAAKLAPGAVTTAAIGFTALDLSGSIRGQGGISAGTAAPGELMAAKKATGDAFSKIERATKAQGIVGWQVLGGTGGFGWYGRMVGDSDVFGLYSTEAGEDVTLWHGSKLADHTGRFRVTGDAAPADGQGISLRFVASIGYLDSYDHTASAWLAAFLRASQWTFQAGGVNACVVKPTGIEVTGAKLNGKNMGYLGGPINAQNTAYTLAVSDCGGRVYSKNSAAQTINVPVNSSVAIPVDDGVIGIVNNGTNPISIVPAVGVTLIFSPSGATGTRTLSSKGQAVLSKVEADVWFVSGPGLS